MNRKQQASSLRKKIHCAAYEADMDALNAHLQQLYHADEAPLEERNTPETFGPILEATLIAIYLGHEEVVAEMTDNVKHLWKGYGLEDEDVDKVEACMEACDSLAGEGSVTEEAIKEALQGSRMEGKVKINRHGLLW